MTSKKQKNSGWLLPDEITGYDLIDVCLKIPDAERYRMAFRGALWSLGKWYNWEKSYEAGDTRAAQAAEYWREILHTYLDIGCEAGSMGCADDCLAVSIIIANQAEININTLINNYTGTPSSVNADCPDDYFDGDGSDERQQALCMAVQSWTKSYVSAWLNKAAIILGLAILGVFVFALPALGWVAALVIGGLAYVTSTYYDALQNEEAVETVACCMYENMLGVAITKANWQASLTGCEYEDGSDEYLIAQILASELGYDKQWVSFLDAIGRAWPLAEAGVQDCACDECTPWQHEIDFTVADGGFTPSPANRALWTSGAGWGRGTALSYAVQIQSPALSEFTITGLKVTVDTALSGRRLGQFRVSDVSGTVYDITVPSGAKEWTITIPGDGKTAVGFWMGVDNYNYTYNGKITGITVYGCGYNPYI